jgi:alkylhydroperoxidase family enzyme
MTGREARVPRLSVDEAKAAAADAGVPDYMADLSVFQVLLRHKGVAKAVNDLLSTLLWHGRLDPCLRELAIMRIGWLTASDYEWTQHWRVALALGVSEQDVLGVRDWKAHTAFGRAERAVLAATDETVQGGAITDKTWAECERALGKDPEVLIELVSAIGTWRMIAFMLLSIDVPLEDGVESWPPDGTAPRPTPY